MKKIAQAEDFRLRSPAQTPAVESDRRSNVTNDSAAALEHRGTCDDEVELQQQLWFY